MIGVSKSAYSLEIAVTALLLFVTLPAESKESSKQRNYKWEDLKRHGQESEMHGLLRVAEQYYRKSIDEALKATGNSSNEYIESTVRLANVLVLQRKFLEAEPYFKKSLEFTEQRRKESSFDREILVWLDDLADSYQTNAEGVKEINCSEHALKLRDLISEHGRHQKLASSLRPLILEYMDKKRFADAAAAAKRLVKADQATYGHLSMRAANDLYTLAELELRLHHLDESESYARQAMSIYLGTENALKLGLVNIRVLLAQVLFERGEISLADKEAREALFLAEQEYGKDGLLSTKPRMVLAEILLKQKRFDEAASQCEQVISITRAKLGDKIAHLKTPMECLKRVYKAKKDLKNVHKVDLQIQSMSKR